MNRIEAWLQEVALLGSQPRLESNDPDCDICALVDKKLWSIVSELNKAFNLDLDNCCLGLDVEKNRLRIRYETDIDGRCPATTTSLYIDRDGSLEWHVTDLATGTTEIYLR